MTSNTARTSLSVSVILLLSACNSGGATTQPTPDGEFEPGSWTITETFGSISYPNVDPSEVEAEKAKFDATNNTHTACLPADQSAKPDQSFFSGAPCAYDRFKLVDGSLDARLTCPAPGGSHIVEMDGTVRRDHFTIHLNHIMDNPNNGQRGEVVTTMEGKRTGEC